MNDHNNESRKLPNTSQTLIPFITIDAIFSLLLSRFRM